MKTFNKVLLLIVAIVCLSLSSFAQRGYDVYGPVRSLSLAAPATYSGGSAVNSGTNAWIDIHGLDGVAKIDVFCFTNVGNSSFTVGIQASSDTTNVVWLGGASIATNVTFIYTNMTYGGTNANGLFLTATNLYNIPGVVTYPNAFTAGWATPYINPAPFTNTLNSVTLTAQAGWTTIGFDAGDALRYIRLIVIPGGAATNGVVGAQVTSHVHSTGWPF